jgi:hypothetical protein
MQGYTSSLARLSDLDSPLHLLSGLNGLVALLIGVPQAETSPQGRGKTECADEEITIRDPSASGLKHNVKNASALLRWAMWPTTGRQPSTYYAPIAAKQILRLSFHRNATRKCMPEPDTLITDKPWKR